MKYLFVILACCGYEAVSAQLTYATVTVDYDSAWQYKNLKIIPIRARANPGHGGQSNLPDILSLNQAIRRGLATVTERGTASTENVHWLRVNNRSEKSLYVASGEIIAGGRQDRMVSRDTILKPTGRDQYIPVMCVEEGRWSDKEKKIVYGNFANPFLRKVLDQGKNQVLIWNEISSQLSQTGIKSKSLAYLSQGLDKKMVMLNDDYFQYFQKKFRNSDSTALGFVAVSGNRVIGCDLFAEKELFYEQLEPLLRGYIDGAVFFGGPVELANPQVMAYMDQILTNEQSQEDFVSKNGKIFRDEGRVIHINTF